MAPVFDPNNSLIADTVGYTSVFLLKEAMVAAGWIVNGSSDGTSHVDSEAKPIGAGTTDYVDTAAKMSNSGSWVVLEGPEGRQFLLGHLGANTDTPGWVGYGRYFVIAYSPSVGWTGGSTIAYPTAADAVTIAGTLSAASAIAIFSNNSSPYYANIYASDTTDSFYCFQSAQGSGVTLGGLFCDSLSRYVAGDVDPCVAGYVAGGVEAFASGAIWGQYPYCLGNLDGDTELLNLMSYARWNEPCAPYNGTRGLGVNPIDSKIDELEAVWGRHSGEGQTPYGYKGVSGLFRAVGGNVPIGDTLNSDGALSRIVLGDLKTSLPWDGTTTPLMLAAPSTDRDAAFRVAVTATPVSYSMRGRIISTSVIHYWTVTGAPDTTGAASGHAGDIDQIVVLR